jgi:hypothetical protein
MCKIQYTRVGQLESKPFGQGISGSQFSIKIFHSEKMIPIRRTMHLNEHCEPLYSMLDLQGTFVCPTQALSPVPTKAERVGHQANFL